MQSFVVSAFFVGKICKQGNFAQSRGTWRHDGGQKLVLLRFFSKFWLHFRVSWYFFHKFGDFHRDRWEKTPGKQFYVFSFLYEKHRKFSSFSRFCAKVTSSATHKNGYISRTAEYFDMRFFVNMHYFWRSIDITNKNWGSSGRVCSPLSK